MQDATSASCVTIIDPFYPNNPWPDMYAYPQPYPVVPYSPPQTFTTSNLLVAPQSLSDDDVERIAQRVAALLKPKRSRKRSRKL